jgi:hypothetical protein
MAPVQDPQFLQGQLFQYPSVDAVDRFIVKFQVPARLLIGGNRCEPENLLGVSFGKSTPDPPKRFNADPAIFAATDFSFGNVKKNSFAANSQIFNDNDGFAVDATGMNTAAT